jgi:cation diffusion facilitator CzcD-associated flavoprotein CzcO
VPDDKGFRAVGFISSAPIDPDAIDKEALKRKYAEERAKRLKPGRAEIVELTGDLAHYTEDPYTTPTTREALSDEVDVIVVGAGFGGLLAAVNMREAGFDRVRLIDKAGDVGGVWYWNRYPGAMCDVESLTYLPLLEETGYVPKDKYAKAPEILAYAQMVTKQYGLYDDALFQTTVTGLEWDEADERWVMRTDRGDSLRASFVVISDGNFHRLKIPAIPGVETFKGHSFHTSRWDYEYTGGGCTTELTRLGDKVVGIIGTGATAAQAVPPLGRAAKHLYVFQRTPSTVGVRANRPLDPDEVEALAAEPGWQWERIQNFTTIVSGEYAPYDLVQDGWTNFYQEALADPALATAGPQQVAARMEQVNFAQMEAIRARVDAIVEDPETAEKLKPYYGYMCTRPCFHDEFLQTFNLPNTTLVDTEGHGIDRITEKGVVVDGVEYELDCLIYATGFEYETSYVQKTGFDIVGRDGVRLSEKYANGVSTFQGLYSRGFPNLFMLPGTHMQNTMTVNVIHVLTENTAHVAYVAKEVRERGARYFDVDETSEKAWVEVCREHSRDNQKALESCTPNRFNAEGDLNRRKLQNANYPLSTMRFFELLAGWREENELAGLELIGVDGAAPSHRNGQHTGVRAAALVPGGAEDAADISTDVPE